MHGVADVCLGLDRERGRFTGVFPCNGTKAFPSIPFGEEELGLSDHEDRWIKLEEMDWKGKSRAAQRGLT